jgi:hypothetical protein
VDRDGSRCSGSWSVARLATLPWPQVPVADRTRDRGHGRVETRQLQVATIVGLDFCTPLRRCVKVGEGRRRARGASGWRDPACQGVRALLSCRPAADGQMEPDWPAKPQGPEASVA